METKSVNSITIRPAKKWDCADIVKLVKELEEYHQTTEHSTITAKELEEHGFGETPCFHCVVAEESTPSNDSRLVGELMYYFTYSTVYGRSAYVEDFYVKPEARTRGIGTKLLTAVTKIALDKGCRCVKWSVLQSNKPTINFYKRLGASQGRKGWLNYMMDKDAMDKLVSRQIDSSGCMLKLTANGL